MGVFMIVRNIAAAIELQVSGKIASSSNPSTHFLEVNRTTTPLGLLLPPTSTVIFFWDVHFSGRVAGIVSGCWLAAFEGTRTSPAKYCDWFTS